MVKLLTNNIPITASHLSVDCARYIVLATNESLQKVVDGIYVTATSAARVDQGFPNGVINLRNKTN